MHKDMSGSELVCLRRIVANSTCKLAAELARTCDAWSKDSLILCNSK